MAPKDEAYLEGAFRRMEEKKTHVSFPQLKYPSLRDEGMRDPVTWLEGKKLDDGAEGLWRVHDGIYDLTSFIDRHPGGVEWLELSKGTDITEAFESHHMSEHVVTMLEKFFIRKAQTPRNSPFTFKDDGFYRTLKREVREELKKVPDSVKNSSHSNMVIDGLLATLAVTSVLSCWFKNDYWGNMISYVIASFALAWVTISSHNYIHKKANWRMYLFSLSTWSYRDYRVSHVLSHHLYPNTLMDLEVSAFEPIVFWNPRKDVPITAHFAIFIEFVIFPFVFLSNFAKRFLSNFTKERFFKNHYRWHDGVGLLLPLWMYIFGGLSFYETIISWLWIVCTASFIFMTIGSNAAHHHPDIFKDGDQPRDLTPDWGMYEVEAVMDRTDINGSLFRVLTFFGDHCLHHMFPTLDHAVLPYLYPVFLKNVQKFKAKFRMSNSIELFIGQIKQTLKTIPSTLNDDE